MNGTIEFLIMHHNYLTGERIETRRINLGCSRARNSFVVERFRKRYRFALDDGEAINHRERIGNTYYKVDVATFKQV